ncbi:UNVERIFIED_CONTAM: Endoglucanase [Acetivibrio alkalicellulosi]
MLITSGNHFIDKNGMINLLRGVNVSGASKIPYTPNGATHINQNFYDYKKVSFIGRPFPLDKCAEHFSRLKAWGFNTLRFIVTWEAIEHEGPRCYDNDYLNYIYEVIKKACEYEIYVFVDFHQDVWSRMSGGDGAPGWTFDEIGMDVTNFTETGAAIIHNIEGDPFPHLIWPTNYTKLAAATMFTLFFGGDVFAPKTKIRGQSTKEFLQTHYINAIKQLVYLIKDIPNVIGYDLINEPSRGYIEWKDLSKFEGRLLKGVTPTPFQSMLLGSGFTQEVDYWEIKTLGFKKTGKKFINSSKKSVWHKGYQCIWMENGIWESNKGKQQLLKPDYFSKVNGEIIDFSNCFMKPFINRIGREIRSIAPNALIFIETDSESAPMTWGKNDLSNVVYAPHWYDAKTLVFKNYTSFFSFDSDKMKVVLGKKNVQKLFNNQLQKKKEESSLYLNGIPAIIGEFGLPFNLNKSKAFKTGNFYVQENAFNSYFRAIENCLLNCTIWNYNCINNNRNGDQWNAEDFSIFSYDQQSNSSNLNSGGRALKAIVRPYAAKIPGKPVKMSFDPKVGTFVFEFIYNPKINFPAEIFVPNLQYPTGILVKASDGHYEFDHKKQLLLYHCHNKAHLHKIMIMRKVA